MSSISSRLITLNRIADYIPIVSTVINLIDLFHKCVTIPRAEARGATLSDYPIYVRDKARGRCILLLLPFIGNVAIIISDFIFGNKAAFFYSLRSDPTSFSRLPTRFQKDFQLALYGLRHQTPLSDIPIDMHDQLELVKTLESLTLILNDFLHQLAKRPESQANIEQNFNCPMSFIAEMRDFCTDSLNLLSASKAELSTCMRLRNQAVQYKERFQNAVDLYNVYAKKSSHLKSLMEKLKSEVRGFLVPREHRDLYKAIIQTNLAIHQNLSHNISDELYAQYESELLEQSLAIQNLKNAQAT